MKKKMVLILLMIIIFTSFALGQQHPANKYDITKDNYYVWKDWSPTERSFYVWGFLSGAYAMGSEVAYSSGYIDLMSYVEQTLPVNFAVGEYVMGVNYFYEEQELRTTPIWAILLRFKTAMGLRREYE